MRNLVEFHGEAFNTLGNYPFVEVRRHRGGNVVVRGLWDASKSAGGVVISLSNREDRPVARVTLPARVANALKMTGQVRFKLVPTEIGSGLKLVRVNSLSEATVRSYQKS